MVVLTIEFFEKNNVSFTKKNKLEVLKNLSSDYSECEKKAISLINSFETKLLNLKDLKSINEIKIKIRDKKFKISAHENQYLIKCPDKRWVEYLIFRHVFNNLSSNKILTDFPVYLLVEPVSICNLRCVMCFQIDKSFSSNKSMMGRMDLKLFKQIIDEAEKKGTKAITLASRGEPTLHKELPEMLRYMKGKFLEVKLNTNATFLNENLCREILASEVTDLVFSIDSYEAENYEKIRKKAKFDVVLKNINRFNNIRTNEFPNHRTTTRVSGVRIDEDQDKDLYSKFWYKYVDLVAMVDLQERWDTYFNAPLAKEKLLPCGDLWERMYIWFDGTVNPCDIDYKSFLKVGNVKDNSIQEIWQSTDYRNFREDHLQGKRSDYDPCLRCDSFTCK